MAYNSIADIEGDEIFQIFLRVPFKIIFGMKVAYYGIISRHDNYVDLESKISPGF